MIEKILVPLDGSELAERALPVAVALAQATQGTVTLLRSTVGMWLPTAPLDLAYAGDYGPYDWLPSVEIMSEIEQEAEEYLDDLAKKHANSQVSLTTHVFNADPAGAIVDYARDEEVDLIVMSSHGRSGLERWTLGSVTERVLRHAPCPVYVVHRAARIVPVHRILIPLDGSELAEAVIGPALDVARLLDASATLLRVVPPTTADELTIAELEILEPGLGQSLLQDGKKRAEKYLRLVRTRQKGATPGLQTVVLTGQAAPAIIDFAAEQEIDLIAMATHGHGGFRRWLYGSVTEKVLRAASCSLLVVRPPLES